MKLIDNPKFVKVVLDKHSDIFIIYITAIKVLITIHPNSNVLVSAL